MTVSTTYGLLIAGTGAVGLWAMSLAYRRSRDAFHPLMISCPIALFMYVVVPFALSRHEELDWYVSVGALEHAQAIFLVLFAAFCAGSLLASGRARFGLDTGPIVLSSAMRRRLLMAAVAMGVAGLLAWGLLMAAEGGLKEVYDEPHGGDVLHPSGWVRESTRLALVGIVLALAARRGRWSWLIALVFAVPHLVHAILGTRRGPLFVTGVLLLAGWYVFQGRRPRLLAGLVAGGTVGVLILFLLANRSRLYYGSQAPLTLDLSDSILFYPHVGNDYVVAAGLVATAARTDQYGWGVSYVEQLFLRPIPRAILPGKYELLGEKTVGPASIGAVLGWRPPPGWAPTLFAHLYIEFAWLSVLASALLGAALGWAWRRAVESPTLGWRTVQVLMTAGLLHLITQEFWAMAVPFLLMFLPTWLALRFAVGPVFSRPLPQRDWWPRRLAPLRSR
jgi:hypothetical protein